MKAIDAIFRRRSVRKYTGKEIEDEKIEKILRAAMYAPSANNEQPWHFIIVKNRESLEKLSEIHRYGKMLKEAALAIVVCADKKLSKSRVDYWVQDCAASTQNILLTSTALGIGSVWLGVYPDMERVKSISEFFELPENIIPLSIVSLGYCEEDVFREIPERYRKERVHLDRW